MSKIQTLPLQIHDTATTVPHFSCRVDGAEAQPVCCEVSLCWHTTRDLDFAWIGRPRFIRDGCSAPLEELNHYLAKEWRKVGPPALADVRGSWALVVHDRQEREMWAVADRFATVPLLYRQLPGNRGLDLSTELSYLLRHEETSPKINPQAALQFLTLRHVADHQHLVAGIHRILPGMALVVNYDAQSVRTSERRYFPLTSRPPSEQDPSTLESASITWIHQALYDELEDGWAFHEKTSGPSMGMLYSGGVDSAFLAANLQEPQRDQLHLATYGFDDRTADIEFARTSIGEIGHLQDRWIPLRVSPEQTPALLDAIIRETSLPVEHPNFLARRHAYQQLADAGVSTVIAGEGADTLLGGAWYVTMQKVLQARRLAEQYRIPRFAWTFAGQINRSRRDLFRLVAERDWRMVCILAKAYVPFEWLSMAAKSLGQWSSDSFPYHTAILDRGGPQAKLEAIYELGLMANMSSELAAEQTMARSFGMAQWHPYLDGLFPDRIAAIPLSLRTKDWRAKYLLYKVARGTVPSVCLNRPKSGCPAPLVTWLTEPNALGDYVDALRNSQSFCSELLGKKAVEIAVHQFRRKPNARDAEILWVLINLERWNAIVLKNRTHTEKKEFQHA